MTEIKYVFPPVNPVTSWSAEKHVGVSAELQLLQTDKLTPPVILLNSNSSASVGKVTECHTVGLTVKLQDPAVIPSGHAFTVVPSKF